MCPSDWMILVQPLNLVKGEERLQTATMRHQVNAILCISECYLSANTSGSFRASRRTSFIKEWKSRFDFSTSHRSGIPSSAVYLPIVSMAGNTI